MLEVASTQMRFDQPILEQQPSLLDKRSFSKTLKS